ncbi:hypothetical protein DFH08DRAFT_802093 [Mycena albidolilacea]|uniref:Glycosyl transferase CAP10 domain-containing protein n=1 Tax=Mycena albidolilacea TaxID=1033008 RepID=A0AAD7EXX8_9AGAR|nr:hypothetical protein DFH08DRAFT_802093 [Mycena albidolilacea]
MYSECSYSQRGLIPPPEVYQKHITNKSPRCAHADIATMVIRNGTLSMGGWTAYGWYLTETIEKNGRDEPRVASNVRAPGAHENALLVTDPTPFHQSHRPTGEFFAHQSGCNIPLEASGFMMSANNASGFPIESAKRAYTTDLYSMLSMTTMSPCFSDILYPAQYYYDRSWRSGKYGYPDNVPWEKKKLQVCKSHTYPTSHTAHAEGSIMQTGAERPVQRPDPLDVHLSTFTPSYCQDGCDCETVMAEYNITDAGEPRQDLHPFKYALAAPPSLEDFSGSCGPVHSCSSPQYLKSISTSECNPVLPDLSDLVEKIEWANANPREARLIQQRGLEVARRVVTDDQNDCYMFAVLLEWARLQHYARSNST